MDLNIVHRCIQQLKRSRVNKCDAQALQAQLHAATLQRLTLGLLRDTLLILPPSLIAFLGHYVQNLHSKAWIQNMNNFQCLPALVLKRRQPVHVHLEQVPGGSMLLNLTAARMFLLGSHGHKLSLTSRNIPCEGQSLPWTQHLSFRRNTLLLNDAILQGVVPDHISVLSWLESNNSDHTLVQLLDSNPDVLVLETRPLHGASVSNKDIGSFFNVNVLRSHDSLPSQTLHGGDDIASRSSHPSMVLHHMVRQRSRNEPQHVGVCIDALETSSMQRHIFNILILVVFGIFTLLLAPPAAKRRKVTVGAAHRQCLLHTINALHNFGGSYSCPSLLLPAVEIINTRGSPLAANSPAIQLPVAEVLQGNAVVDAYDPHLGEGRRGSINNGLQHDLSPATPLLVPSLGRIDFFV
mmetsp:Transcript_57222/g.136048  ORF Transcript_57222/g.136048 Transcript_57222/m.136048 type:complete len:408 (-) Transcript_57222:575-1798(-)